MMYFANDFERSTLLKIPRVTRDTPLSKETGKSLHQTGGYLAWSTDVRKHLARSRHEVVLFRATEKVY